MGVVFSVLIKYLQSSSENLQTLTTNIGFRLKNVGKDKSSSFLEFGKQHRIKNGRINLFPV